jgi:hypothetical protein
VTKYKKVDRSKDDVKTTDAELLKLYRARLKDRQQAKTRRRRQMESAPLKFESLLGQYFKRDAEVMRRIEENRALQAWPAYVGESVARYSEAVRIRNRTLIVKVADPLWMQQLSLAKFTLLRKFQRGFPKLQLKDIFFTH